MLNFKTGPGRPAMAALAISAMAFVSGPAGSAATSKPSDPYEELHQICLSGGIQYVASWGKTFDDQLHKGTEEECACFRKKTDVLNPKGIELAIKMFKGGVYFYRGKATAEALQREYGEDAYQRVDEVTRLAEEQCDVGYAAEQVMQQKKKEAAETEHNRQVNSVMK